MGRKRIIEGRNLTGAEAKRRHDDKAAGIDADMKTAFGEVDAARKARASKSLRAFVDAYMVGFVLETRPSPMTYRAMAELERALLDCRPVQIQLPRGSGKTTLASIAVLYLLSTARRKFAVIVSQNARSAANILKDIWRMVAEDSAYSRDFPEMCRPFQLCNGSYRRRQLFRGVSTGLVKTASTIVFPRLVGEDGADMPTSGAAICTRGITSGIRGLKLPAPTGRPDCVLLDDLLDAKSAASEETTEKLLDIIRKDIFNLSSGKKLGIVMTSTPLLPDDLTDRLRQDPAWRTIRYPAVIAWPTDAVERPEDGLWRQYFDIYDDENAKDERHARSLAFYRAHRREMDAGAKVFQNRFRRADGHVSGLQALMEKRHTIGNAAFQAEMQLAPVKFSLALEISPKDVIGSETDAPEGALPDGYQFAVASSDLNLSFCVSTTVVAFKADGTAHVMRHIFRKCSIGGRVADAEYNAKAYRLLVAHGQEIARLGIPLKGWAIDANGLPFDAVTGFCANAPALCGLRACGFTGRASHVFNPNSRAKLRTAIGRTVLCGDAEERVRAGAGKRWVQWDSDFYRERVQSGFLKPPGLAGGLTLYRAADPSEHRDYAAQVCAERLKLKRRRADGRDEYTWKSFGDHDMLDSTAQAFACAAQFGISADNFERDGAPAPVRAFRRRKRRITLE